MLFYCGKLAGTREMQTLINSHVESSKIGRQIADQVVEYQRRICDSSSGIIWLNTFVY